MAFLSKKMRLHCASFHIALYVLSSKYDELVFHLCSLATFFQIPVVQIFWVRLDTRFFLGMFFSWLQSRHFRFFLYFMQIYFAKTSLHGLLPEVSSLSYCFCGFFSFHPSSSHFWGHLYVTRVVNAFGMPWKASFVYMRVQNRK